MLISEYIDHNIPLLKSSDSVATALNYMEELKLEQLALVDGTHIVLFNEQHLLEYDEDLLLDKIPAKHVDLYIEDSAHPLAAAALMTQYDLEILPVVDADNQFLGIVPGHTLFRKLIGVQLEGHGSILRMQIKYNDFSLSEISRIVESEGFRIEGLFVEDLNEHEYVFILKLNKAEASMAISSLKRFGYKVEQITGLDSDHNLDKDRFGMLMKYLEI
ncbi:hypothetical protein LAG90_05490 [Marinilongibacter aquaticus]|uniref:CBS domain-containing protein n=1 Tax=Marinilongibacter aquaticus TaxID=2975157 RepID=UPI0021BD289A|nr:CBS domain-containing protein [Marinilongibacter aquaticus]UBM60093.1 hypothetical protein LAG90_05490 [Marinilongibacter aquaticus]